MHVVGAGADGGGVKTLISLPRYFIKLALGNMIGCGCLFVCLFVVSFGLFILQKVKPGSCVSYLAVNYDAEGGLELHFHFPGAEITDMHHHTEFVW